MANRINVPTLIEFASQDDDLTLANLLNVDHPVNSKSLSGKRAGVVCMIEESVYMATGSSPQAGWKKIDVASDLLDRTRAVYATMAITQRDFNDNDPYEMVVQAHPSGNNTLNPPSTPVAAGSGPFGGYYKLTDLVEEGDSKELTVTSEGEILVEVDGEYVSPVAYAHFRHDHGNATVAFVFGIERDGFITFSQRVVVQKQPQSSDLSNVAGGGRLNAKAGDKISVWIASDRDGTVTIPNANVTIQMIEDQTVL